MLTRDIVINELSPLHHHGGELLSGYVSMTMDQSADHSGTRERFAVHAEAYFLHAVAVLGR